MDIVGALGRFEGCVHRLDVAAAVGEPRVTICAGSARLLPVFFVTSQATETFVDSCRRAIIARSNLATRDGCVALVAEGLALVGADLDEAGALVHLRQGQAVRARG